MEPRLDDPDLFFAIDDLPVAPRSRCHGNAVFIGFDVQVNNDGLGDGVRSSVATWTDTSGNAYSDPSQFGALQLVRTGR